MTRWLVYKKMLSISSIQQILMSRYNGQPTQNFQGDTSMLDRRDFLAVCSRFGLTTTSLPGVLWAMADEKGKVTRDMIDSAAAVADVHILDEYKDMMLDSL